MSNTEAPAWQRTSPLSAIFFVGKILEAVAKNAVQSVAPLAAYVIASEGPITRNIAVGIALFLVAIVVIGVLRYLFFRFRIEDASILIRDGVFRKTQLDIKFDRVQAVSIRQNVIYRPFDLVNVILDTAGSSEQEGYLPAIPRRFAESLESRLEHHSRANAAIDSQDTAEKPPEKKTALLRYGSRDLVIAGLTSNRAIIFLAILAPFIETLFEQFAGRVTGDDVSGAARRLVEYDTAAVVGTALAFTALIVLFLLSASILGAVFRFFRFELSVDESRFRSVGGLLTRHEHSVRYTKIQALYVRQNPVQRLFQVFQLNARQAASGRESNRKSFVVPLLRTRELSAMGRKTFGSEYPDLDLRPLVPAYSRVDHHFVRSNVLLRGVAPAGIAMFALLPILQAFAAMTLLWIPATLLYYLRRYRCLGVRLQERGLCLRGGLFGFRVVALLYRKVQRVTVVQSPFQRRRRLATLKLYLASGVVRVPYLRLVDAERLRDYVLFQVESDRRAWH